MAQEKRDNREVVWCWAKKYPCQPMCYLWDFEKKKCKFELAVNRVLAARMLD